MIDQSLARTTRQTAEDLGRLCGISPFYSIALMRLERGAAVELCKEAVRQHPRDVDARGLYVRHHAARQTNGEGR